MSESITNTAAGFSKAALAEWIVNRLGGMTWRLEGFDCLNTANQTIEDAATKYSEQCPMFGYASLAPAATRWEMPEGAYGVIKIDFIDSGALFMQTTYDVNTSLTGVASIAMAGGNVGELADWLQWRKMFQRVTSQRPTYVVDEVSNIVLIANPTGYKPCVLYTTIRPFDRIKLQHRTWIRDYALAEAKELLGRHRSKFGGQIQGPGGTTITLDSKDLLDEAKDDKEKLDKKLDGMRPRMPIMFD